MQGTENRKECIICGSRMDGCICRNCEAISNRMVHTGFLDGIDCDERVMMNLITQLRRENKGLMDENREMRDAMKRFKPMDRKKVEGRFKPLPAFMLPRDESVDPIIRPWEAMAIMFDYMAMVADFVNTECGEDARNYMVGQLYSLEKTMADWGVDLKYYIPGTMYEEDDAEVCLVPTTDYELDGIVKSNPRFGVEFFNNIYEKQKAYVEVYSYFQGDFYRNEPTGSRSDKVEDIVDVSEGEN